MSVGSLTRTSCGWNWLLSPPCLSMWGNPQLLTPDQSQWCSPMTHCLSLTPQCPGQLCLTDVPGRVSVMVFSAHQGLHNHPVVGVSITLDFTGGEINELWPRVGRAVASSRLNSIVRLRLDRWKDALTAYFSFLGLSVGPFATLIIGSTVRGAVALHVFGTNGEHECWEPD